MELAVDTPAERKKTRTHFGVFHGLAWLGGSENDHVITCQIERLRTRRARATEPGRRPNLLLLYTRVPCVPLRRMRERRPAAG